VTSRRTDIVRATTEYEAWVDAQTPPVENDRTLKHRRMRSAVLPFLRGTFYRWASLWPKACPALAAAPVVLAVGDLHFENFGTWRDSHGRLVWGVNDFDEAFPLAYTNDLVRLAASVLLAIKEEKLSIAADQACDALLDGYARGIAGDGSPFVLEEQHSSLRSMAQGEARDPTKFWRKLARSTDARPPRVVRRLVRGQLPDSAAAIRFVHRIAGVGSLGRERYAGVARYRDASIAREAKPLVLSACSWLSPAKKQKSYSASVVKRAVRDPDPFFEIKNDWIVRRLAPDCCRIELADMPRRRNERDILTAMGREVANIHLGSHAAVPAIRRDLRRQPQHWLHHAAETMADITLEDWKAWRSHSSGKRSPAGAGKR
jgi:hypothetical protein